MNATAAKAQRKIGLLNALIAHPRTGEAEREAARRMLARVIAKARAEGIQLGDNGAVDRRTYGAKYDHTHTMDIADIAKQVREDIKLARKIAKLTVEPGALATLDALANAPVQMKFGVRISRFSGGCALDVRVKNIPADWWTERTDDRGDVGKFATPALKAVAAELKQILDAYNHDGSDLLTDYFDVRFYGHVLSEDGLTLA
jgi:hypothetical protein